MNLFVLCNMATPETLRLVQADPETPLLLVGRAVLGDLKVFGERPLYVMAEEIHELGFESRLGASVQSKPSSELIQMICESHILNLD